VASETQTQAPAEQTGVALEQTRQPAGDDPSPQRAGSVAEQEAHAPFEQ
jgi:hypothetical protein